MNSLTEVISVCGIWAWLNKSCYYWILLWRRKNNQCSGLVSIAGFGGCIKQMDKATQNGSYRKPLVPQAEVQGQDCGTVTNSG